MEVIRTIKICTLLSFYSIFLIKEAQMNLHPVTARLHDLSPLVCFLFTGNVDDE